MGNVAANRSGKERLAAFFACGWGYGFMKQREQRKNIFG